MAEIAERILQGASAGYEVKDFLHEFQVAGSPRMFETAPVKLENRVSDGLRLDAFLQALAVYLAAKIDVDPPSWTRPAIQLQDPWFASPGRAIRNYLLMSSPAPFRSRNLFIDADSLEVV
ncbi:MAG TPA: hypothetical protein VHZ30_03285 [Verrucomicrobiae bacterium]|nr:hypothetical protein [Verrucomicrobiae bacterium]